MVPRLVKFSRFRIALLSICLIVVGYFQVTAFKLIFHALSLVLLLELLSYCQRRSPFELRIRKRLILTMYVVGSILSLLLDIEGVFDSNVSMIIFVLSGAGQFTSVALVSKRLKSLYDFGNEALVEIFVSIFVFPVFVLRYGNRIGN